MEKTMIININDKLKTCGIYKINYENGKIYIGQALNIYIRALEHNNKNKYPCDKALKKYNATIEVLEETDDASLLEELECKWIKYFDANNKIKGYNLTPGGNASGKKGVENLQAVLNQEQLNEIIDLLINHLNLSYSDIANKYNVSSATIYKIANGYTYINKKLDYPLRPNNHLSVVKNDVLDYFNSVEELLNLKIDLCYRWDLTIEKDLVKKYNIPLKIIREINHGTKFQEYGDFIYPIRKKNLRNNNNYSIDDVKSILNDLRNTKDSMETIGKKYNTTRKTISKINQGESYPIQGYDYPAR